MLKAVVSNKCFIHCPAEDKAETIIYWSKLQNEHKLDYTGGIIDKTAMNEAVDDFGMKYAIWVKYPLSIFTIITVGNIAYS